MCIRDSYSETERVNGTGKKEKGAGSPEGKRAAAAKSRAGEAQEKEEKYDSGKLCLSLIHI